MNHSEQWRKKCLRQRQCVKKKFRFLQIKFGSNHGNDIRTIFYRKNQRLDGKRKRHLWIPELNPLDPIVRPRRVHPQIWNFHEPPLLHSVPFPRVQLRMSGCGVHTNTIHHSIRWLTSSELCKMCRMKVRFAKRRCHQKHTVDNGQEFLMETMSHIGLLWPGGFPWYN